MHTHEEKKQENKDHSVANTITQKQGNKATAVQFKDNRPEALAQRKMQEAADHYTLQRTKENKTGLPDNLKSGIENLSGYTMDDVKVHYNSGKPAQLQAHAYTQGSDIHVAPGQEKHLPHEAWHVVQQKQGRVKPTLQMKGKVNINDDAVLEKEADVMGNKAMQMKEITHIQKKDSRLLVSGETVQRMGIEKFNELLETTTINGVKYSYEDLVQHAEEHPNPTISKESLDREIEGAKGLSDVERIIRNVVRDYRTAKGAKGNSGHFLEGGLPEDDFSHTEEWDGKNSVDQNVSEAINKLPEATGTPSSKFLTPGMNPNRMGFLVGNEIGEKGDKTLKKTGKHFAEISFTKESFFVGGDDEKESFFVVLRTGAENFIKERIQKIREQKDLTGEGFYHTLLGIVSGYESEEILGFLNNGHNTDNIKDIKVSVYKYFPSKNGPFKGHRKVKLYDIK